MLAMDFRATRSSRQCALSLTSIASRLAPTGDPGAPEKVRSAIRPPRFAFDRGRPINHDGRMQALRSGETGRTPV
jgi:hypothetical protein